MLHIAWGIMESITGASIAIKTYKRKKTKIKLTGDSKQWAATLIDLLDQKAGW